MSLLEITPCRLFLLCVVATNGIFAIVVEKWSDVVLDLVQMVHAYSFANQFIRVLLHSIFAIHVLIALVAPFVRWKGFDGTQDPRLALFCCIRFVGDLIVTTAITTLLLALSCSVLYLTLSVHDNTSRVISRVFAYALWYVFGILLIGSTLVQGASFALDVDLADADKRWFDRVRSRVLVVPAVKSAWTWSRAKSAMRDKANKT